MSIAALRDENEHLKALLAQTQAALSEHQGALAASEEARRRLEVILDELRRDRFGAKSEKLRPDQYHLPLEDVEIAQGILDVAQERAEKVIQRRSRSDPDQGSHRSRGCLPAHLPQVERIIEPASTLCPCGCGAMTKIGEDVSKRLDVIPAQWRVLVTRRPKYICRRCSGSVVQAHAPEHVVPGGLPTESAIAHVIVAKFGDHTPFYRQAEIYARQGIRLDRATLGNWSGRACFHLQPIADHMRHHLAMADRLFMDETKAPVLDLGRGQTKKGCFWAIASDDRGHSGPSPPVVLFRYAPVPVTLRLDRLHLTLQEAFGWTNSHLFEFFAGEVRWGIPDPHNDYGHEPIDASKARLCDIVRETGAKTIHYLYDFGDSWDHVIELEKWFDNTTTEGLPLLLEAAGRCPPEDVGGAPGYAEYLDAISDPAHPEHEHMRLWGPERFDPNVVDRKALEAAVNALSDTWKPRRRATRTK